MAFLWLSGIWKTAKAVEAVFELAAATKAAFVRTETRLDALEQRMLQLETDRRELVVEARAAAATAASVAASAHLTELARQLGAPQEQMRALRETDGAAAARRPARRLPPLDGG